MSVLGPEHRLSSVGGGLTNEQNKLNEPIFDF